ncbi:MAG: D-alanyl-D-alanine carboxypeptidase [Chitinophagaceae bacterium]|nr:D-alanyl-D-alanine carboxypeptidase [Chitinophagaceae bacterium]HQV05366.1 D-alanyl-D-alanine carboxypeptidase [Chitinophagaceae bacterium]
MKKNVLQKDNAIWIFILIIFFTSSCSVSKQISGLAQKDVLETPALKNAHVGICIYDPATQKYLYNFQSDKYFIPASNTKISTCYVAMKYLGDSLPGLQYSVKDNQYFIQATGDPTFMTQEFSYQPVFDFFKNLPDGAIVKYATDNWQDTHWGAGWSWGDYTEYYMAERSPFPIYGNMMSLYRQGESIKTIPSFFERDVKFAPGAEAKNAIINRRLDDNTFTITKGNEPFEKSEMPFVTDGFSTTLSLLPDTLHKALDFVPVQGNLPAISNPVMIYSQPTDAMLKPLMHRSDNFYAEQSLMMVSQKLLGVMNDRKIIQHILQTDFKDLPQRPSWADGSGLSRYNLFTPQDIVAILQKMKDEFGMPRIQTIFETGGEGTIRNYYKEEKGFIYAKTGTLNGVVAFSGFLTTKKGKHLIFSTLVNNHNASTTDVRKAVEKFLRTIRNDY